MNNIAYCSSTQEEINRIFIRNLKIENNNISRESLLRNYDLPDETNSHDSIFSEDSIYSDNDSLSQFRMEFNVRKTLFTIRSLQIPYIKGFNYHLPEESSILIKNLIYETNVLFTNNIEIIKILNNFNTDNISINRYIVLLNNLNINNQDLLIQINNTFLKVVKSYLEHFNFQKEIKIALVTKLKDQQLIDKIINEYLNIQNIHQDISLYISCTKNLNMFLNSLNIKIENQITHLEYLESLGFLENSFENVNFEQYVENILHNPYFQNMLNFFPNDDIILNDWDLNIENFPSNHSFFSPENLNEILIQKNKILLNSNKIESCNILENVVNNLSLSEKYIEKQTNLNYTFLNLYNNNQNSFIDFIFKKGYNFDINKINEDSQIETNIQRTYSNTFETSNSRSIRRRIT